jgi:pimeloyl-ACP methyl ester carboxylesterase
MEPFKVEVSDEALADLRHRLDHARFPAQIEGSGWDYGTELGYLKELVRYWREDYDWRAQEASINAFPQFRTVVDGQRVHAVHARSPEAGALPLLVVHGWPGSIVEFLKVLGPLSDPVAHGGEAADAFHVVAPSLPGYAFSGPTTEPGWDTRRIAAALAEVMGRLGYDRFGAQGGDWGSMVCSQLARLEPDRLTGLHLNMVIAGPPEGDDLSGLSEKEMAGLADMATYDKVDSGYAKIQGTKPQTLGYGLNDSPVGLAAWIVEKFRTWSDCGGDVESSFTKDELLTNIMLYWLTETANSSARLYYETQKSGRYGLTDGRVEVPTGCAVYPREIIRPPRSWAEAHYNVVRWSEMPRGGHFAAFEEPELFVEEVRAFFSDLRPG